MCGVGGSDGDEEAENEYCSAVRLSRLFGYLTMTVILTMVTSLPHAIATCLSWVWCYYRAADGVTHWHTVREGRGKGRVCVGRSSHLYLAAFTHSNTN